MVRGKNAQRRRWNWVCGVLAFAAAFVYLIAAFQRNPYHPVAAKDGGMVAGMPISIGQSAPPPNGLQSTSSDPRTSSGGDLPPDVRGAVPAQKAPYDLDRSRRAVAGSPAEARLRAPSDARSDGELADGGLFPEVKASVLSLQVLGSAGYNAGAAEVHGPDGRGPTADGSRGTSLARASAALGADSNVASAKDVVSAAADDREPFDDLSDTLPRPVATAAQAKAQASPSPSSDLANLSVKASGRASPDCLVLGQTSTVACKFSAKFTREKGDARVPKEGVGNQLFTIDVGANATIANIFVPVGCAIVPSMSNGQKVVITKALPAGQDGALDSEVSISVVVTSSKIGAITVTLHEVATLALAGATKGSSPDGTVVITFKAHTVAYDPCCGPVKTGISRLPADNRYYDNVNAVVIANIYPVDITRSVRFDTTNTDEVTVEELLRVNVAGRTSVWLKLHGKTPTPVEAKAHGKSDAGLVATEANRMNKPLPISVVVPKSDEESVGKEISYDNIMEAKNTLAGTVTLAHFETWAKTEVTIRIFDQFGDPLNALYDGKVYTDGLGHKQNVITEEFTNLNVHPDPTGRLKWPAGVNPFEYKGELKAGKLVDVAGIGIGDDLPVNFTETEFAKTVVPEWKAFTGTLTDASGKKWNNAFGLMLPSTVSSSADQVIVVHGWQVSPAYTRTKTAFKVNRPDALAKWGEEAPK